MAAPWMEHLVKWLSDYIFQIVPLLSLFMYLILAVFSDSRRRENKGWKRAWKRLLVWLAYQLTDWGPAYVISNLYLGTKPHEKMSIAFWVPFLLLHHARPDNISAYAMEDSKLWMRLCLLALLKSAGSFIIVYRFILDEHTAGRLLCWVSGIMLALGILKYMESILALWRSDMGHIRHIGLSDKQKLNLDDYRDQENPSELEDEKALLVSHDLFEICKGAFCDYAVNMDRVVVMDMFAEDRWGSMCKVVEMELSLMYDILYTKASVVHTWHGYVIRVASPPLTAAALLLFILQCKNGMKPIDEIVSYILLCTTFLDLRWMLRALASAWTHSYLKRMPPNWLKHEFLCQERWAKLRGLSLRLSRLSLWLWTCACPKEPRSYRRWAGSFGQCTAGNRHNLHSIPRLVIEWEGHSSWRDFEWEDHSRGLEIPEYVKEVVFTNIWENLFRDPVEQLRQEDRAAPSNPSYPTQVKQPAPVRFPVIPRPQNPPPRVAPVPVGRAVPSNPCPAPETFTPPRQLRLLLRLVPPNSPTEEQATEHSTDHWRYNQAPSESYEQVNVNLWRANSEGAPPQTNEKAADIINQTTPLDANMEFRPELQEAILVWHIATDVFLLCSPTPTEQAKDKEAIKQISDYMMFLVAKRPEMLPGLTLRSLHERTRHALELICKKAKHTSTSGGTNDKAVARWMLDNPNSAVWEETQDQGEDNSKVPGTMSMTTVLEGTQLARMLLRLPPEEEKCKFTKGVVAVQKLAYWIHLKCHSAVGELGVGRLGGPSEVPLGCGLTPRVKGAGNNSAHITLNTSFLT
ncbi:uncharacterized protein LOC119350869 [Triticum dicoccoides]|uniref:uncharacterized protein LOC119350869 n=1 Tax=Triticum dicoccoides TaxID=85692 RepID=UPI00188E81B3|nr:uncharacterized protein LOC119350869 [Triticum dicoccoides]